MKLSKDHVELVEQIVDLMSDHDRLGMYVFAESVCEVEAATRVSNRDRLKKSLTSAVKAFQEGEGNVNRKCVAEVGDRNITGLLDTFAKGGKLKAALIDSLKGDDLDDRKRAILVITDGVDDPERKYTLGNADGNFERLREDFDISHEKYRKAKEKHRKAKETLRILTRQVSGDGILRYFDVAFLWSWSAMANKEIFGQNENIAREGIRYFWGKILDDARFNQFLKNRGLFPLSFGNAKGEEPEEDVVKHILEALRIPRSIKIYALCKPPCLTIDESARRWTAPIIQMFIESTYERKIPSGVRELRIRGWTKEGIKPRDLAFDRELAADIHPIEGSGPKKADPIEARVKNWQPDEDNEALVNFPFLQVQGRDGDMLAEAGSQKLYRLALSPLMDLRLSDASQYTRISRDRVRFIRGTDVRVTFGIPASISPSDIESKAKLHRDSSQAVVVSADLVVDSRSDPKGRGRVGGQSIVFASFSLDVGVKAGTFIPALVPRPHANWLKLEEKGGKDESRRTITVIRVIPWVVVICFLIYAALCGLRLWGLSRTWKPNWRPLPPDRERRWSLGFEIAGCIAYLFALQIAPRFPLWTDDPWVQMEALSAAYGTYFVPSLLTLPVICPLVTLVSMKALNKIPIADALPTAQRTVLPWAILLQAFVAWLGAQFNQLVGVVVVVALAFIWLAFSAEDSKAEDSKVKLALMYSLQITLDGLTAIWLLTILLDVLAS